ARSQQVCILRVCMPVALTINGYETHASPGGASLFDHAEKLGVHVPTSCQKNGKCKECVVEVTEGIELLSGRTDAERHLRGNFRLSCQTQIIADAGAVTCHTMRRGQMRIEGAASGLPLREKIALDPAVTRDGAHR